MRKIDELGKDFDSKMVQWKNQVEHQRKMENSLTAIEKCLLSKSCDVVNSRDASAKEALGVSYTVVDESRAVGNHAARIETAFEPEHLKIHVSSTEPEDCVIASNEAHNESMDITSPTVCSTVKTLSTLELDGTSKENLAANEMEVLKMKVKKEMGLVFNETIYEEAVSFLQSCVNCTLVSKRINVETLKSYITNWKSGGPSSYQIIGDNVDMMIKIKHQASTKPNKSIHWFHLLGVKDRAIAYDLADDKPIGSTHDLQPGDILPSTKDNQELLHDFIPLFARVAVDKVPAFEIFKDVVVRHIPHRYSDAMKLQSEQASTVY